MLYFYTYVPHTMEKMQRYIDYIFFVVWCNAPSRPYNIKLFAGWKDLKDVISAFHYDDTKGGNFFNAKIEEIYQHFSQLSSPDIDQLKKWYISNNAIEQICNNDPAISIVRYKQLKLWNEHLSDALESFFKKLYGQDILPLKVIKDKIGDINDHYDSFMTINGEGKCPFCGYNDIKGVYHTTREAYDHFFSKGIYPFNSINFKNLVPACHECNSSYKNQKDPNYVPADPVANAQGHTRKSFYVYTNYLPDVQISVNLLSGDLESLAPDDIDISVTSVNYQEQVDTWMSVYGIKERFKAKCLAKHDGQWWYLQIRDECQNYGMTPRQFLEIKLREAVNKPLADVNFLRKPFLEACDQLNLFSVIP